MLVKPATPTANLGVKNVDTKDPKVGFAIYRKRFAPLADDIALKAEMDDGSWVESGDPGVLGPVGTADDSSTDGESVARDSADE